MTDEYEAATLRSENAALKTQVEGWTETARLYATNDADRQAERDALKAALEDMTNDRDFQLRRALAAEDERNTLKTELNRVSRGQYAETAEERDSLKAALLGLRAEMDSRISQALAGLEEK